MDRLRRGRKTPFDEVERRIGDLLKQYPRSQGPGQIYYEAAHVYAQTGLVRPQAAVDYAKKALRFPLEPVQRIRLYGYWGGAVFMLKRTDPFPHRRLAAATIFLDGLVQLRQFNLPEKATESPVGRVADIVGDKAAERDAAGTEPSRCGSMGTSTVSARDDPIPRWSDRADRVALLPRTTGYGRTS